MADGRVIGKEAGHSAKVAALSDFEHRVWVQTLCAPTSDDFGVMPASAHQVQAANTALENRPMRKVTAALDVLTTVGLLRQFAHQGKRFLWHPRWQFWQNIRWPRATTFPIPPDDELQNADASTRELFGKHHARAAKDSRNTSEELPRVSETSQSLAYARTPETLTLTLTPNPNPERFGSLEEIRNARTPEIIEATGSLAHRRTFAPGLVGNHQLRCPPGTWAACERGLCVPVFLADQWRQQLNGDEGAIKAFVESALARLPDGPVGDDPLTFWRAMWTAEHGSQAPRRSHSKTGDTVDAMNAYTAHVLGRKR